MKYFSLLLFLFFLSGCDQPKTYFAKDAPAPPSIDGQYEKPQSPPQYSPEQFAVGQFWIWKENNNPHPKCIRWEIANISSEGIEIDHQTSVKCPQFNATSKKILFNPYDGKILENESNISFTKDNSIRPFFFTSQQQARIKRSFVKDQVGKNMVNIFKLEKSNSWYFDMPGGLMHAVLYKDDQITLIDAGQK